MYYLFLALFIRYPETVKAFLLLLVFVGLVFATNGWFLLVLLISVCIVYLVHKIYESNVNFEARKKDYEKRIGERNRIIENLIATNPDVTIRKGDKERAVLPKAYIINIYEGLKNMKTCRHQDENISINFKISEDFKGFVVGIKNIGHQTISVNWASSTISDNHVLIDDVPYSDYMSLGRLHSGEYVTKTLREKSLMCFLWEEDILRQDLKLTNNAAYVIRIPITLESGKKINYKFPIVTDRAD